MNRVDSDASPGEEKSPRVWNSATSNGRYLLTLRPEDGELPIGPIHRWILEVRTPEGEPVEGAGIVVGGGMEDHGHGLPTVPEATDSPAPGTYRIDGVKFSMAGQWTLTIRVDAGGIRDAARFLIDVDY